jgi:hypothetical protein
MGTAALTMFGPTVSQASRLGHQWAGVEHVILGILDNDGHSLAASVLHDLGLTAAIYEREFVERLLNTKPPVRSSIDTGVSVQASPRFYQLGGWVDGYCLARGVDPSRELWLLAICYDSDRPIAAGVDRRRVVQALEARGIPVPEEPPAADAAVPSWRRLDVPLDAIGELVAAIKGEPGFVGFNTDRENEHAWVTVKDQPDIVVLTSEHLQRLAQH